MRHTLLTATLFLSFGLAACADHSGNLVADTSTTQSPVAPPDESNISPAPPTGNSENSPAPGENSGPAAGSGSAPAGGAGGGGAGSPVPEPGTMLLVGTGLAGAALMRRRKQPQVETTDERA